MEVKFNMLFTEDLEEIIFNRHEVHEADELVILSGYLGPRPVRRLSELPIRTSVVYGMYGADGISQKLHSSLSETHTENDNVEIFYSKTGIHSKCYAWKNRGSITHALIGSANFSNKGMNTPNREMLAECTRDTFSPLQRYLENVLRNSIECLDDNVSFGPNRTILEAVYEKATNNSLTGRLTLLDRSGEVPPRSGLNWGQGIGNVTPNDAYIAIRMKFLRENPFIIPPKDKLHAFRLPKQPIELIWDDGVIMDGSLEGNNSSLIDGEMYPKQLTTKSKADMGAYLRRRLGLRSGQKVTRKHLDDYGRTDISITLVGEGIYELDFSV